MKQEVHQDLLDMLKNQRLPKKCKIFVAISYLDGPWESVSMDFVLSFLFSNGFDTNMVVYWFNKMAHFIPIANISIA
jgi:hypothetical protein